MEDMKLSDAIELINILNPKKKTPENKTLELGYNIVVLQRGWVVVGFLIKNGSMYTLKNAAVIRTWGTTKGLPEIINGPLVSTKLDKSARPFHFHELTTVFILEVSDEWSKTLL